MTDLEIVNYLSSLEPESPMQEYKIRKAIKEIYGFDISLIKHFENLAWDEIEGKTAEFVYDEYYKWCLDNDYMPVGKTVVGKFIAEHYKLLGRNEMAGGYDINEYGKREYKYKLRRVYRSVFVHAN